MSVTLAELAARFGCELAGDPDVALTGVGTLANAGPGDLSFLANPRYKDFLGKTQAGAVVLAADALPDCPVPALISENPYALYARAAAFLQPAERPQAGVHSSATIDPGARISESAHIGPQVVVGADAVIEENVVVGAGSVIGARCVIGANSLLHANVTLCDSVTLGKRVILHPGAVLGSDGFGLAREPGGWIKVPQLGGVLIGDDVEVGACTSIDRGAVEDTVIGNGVKLDNQIQVAHNVRIGEHTVVAACAGISGSTIVGKRCVIAGMVGFVGHLDIADDVVVTGRSMVSRSLSKAGTYSGALPVDEAGRWRKNAARFRKLDDLARKVAALEKRLRKLQEQGSDDD